ncbi:GNAT family N-acetyltransferase, partial [Streptococcus sp.]
EILGFLGYAKLFFFEADGSYYRILALSVAKETRRQGIASRLIDELKKQAVKEGVEALALNSGLTAERNAAHQFYQAVGFEKVTAGFALHLKTQPK